MAAAIEKLEPIIQRYGARSHALVAIMAEVQSEFHYLPLEVMVLLSDRLHLPLSRIYSVATFYNAFSLTPRGDHLVSACLGTACHVKGGHPILEKIKRELKIEPGQTTKDLGFSLEEVRCLGCCSIAPVVKIDEEIFGSMTSEKALGVLREFRNG